jgi:hypothetical protein
MTGRWRINRPLWGAGIAVWLIAAPATAQQESLLPARLLPPASEPRAVNAVVQQPSPAGGPAKDDPKKKGDDQSGTSNNRLFGALPDFLTVENKAYLPPLTTKQKFDVTIRSTFDMGQYLFFGGLAGISQAENADPSYRQGATGYAKRFGLAFADGTTENLLTSAIFASVFHQDPRYLRLGTGSILHRTGYSLSRIFVTRSDAGHAQFNVSEILGSATAAGLYNTYHPASDRTMANTLATWWMQVGYDTGFIVVREFWPDVRRKFGKHTK